MTEQSAQPGDRNFDELVNRFQRNIYASLKGQIRLGVVERDFAEFLPEQDGEKPLRVLDAGGGQGQMAIHFARRSHKVVLCDISGKMLEIAREKLSEEGLLDRVEIHHAPIQEVVAASTEPYDIIICHAVIEWLADPKQVLHSLAEKLEADGALSLLYYNLNGLIYKNLLRTNFKKIRKQAWQGYRGSLTPTSPLRPEQVDEWIAALPLERKCESGIRVFYDYIFNQDDRRRDPEGILEMELAHSRRMPFMHLARYIHLLCRKR
ncbi:methyltransferase domain-containing protein [Proteobacteria bacterium 005FR1]|nr:methyltransferase domain-containing protein [Proteobacteria bacterium 005FR1]